jgi:hypothetical protein
MRIFHLKVFQTAKIALTAMGTWTIHTTAKMTGRQTLSQIWNWTRSGIIQIPRSSGM